jgi:hypothetical protein
MFRGASVLESEVSESGEFDAVTDEIRRWARFSEVECQPFVTWKRGQYGESVLTGGTTFRS